MFCEKTKAKMILCILSIKQGKDRVVKCMVVAMGALTNSEMGLMTPLIILLTELFL